jgi:hypothetical protein
MGMIAASDRMCLVIAPVPCLLCRLVPPGEALAPFQTIALWPLSRFHSSGQELRIYKPANRLLPAAKTIPAAVWPLFFKFHGRSCQKAAVIKSEIVP